MHIVSSRARNVEQRSLARRSPPSSGADGRRDHCQQGLVSQTALSTAEAELAESEARVLAAQLQIRVARARLTRAIGG